MIFPLKMVIFHNYVSLPEGYGILSDGTASTDSQQFIGPVRMEWLKEAPSIQFQRLQLPQFPGQRHTSRAQAVGHHLM